MKKFPLLLSAVIALIVSLIANAILVYVFLPLTDTPETMMTFKVLGPTGTFTVIGIVGATIVFFLIRLFSRNPNKLFTIISTIALLLSFIPDIFAHSLGEMFAQLTTGGIILLMALHVAVAVVTVYTFTRFTKPTQRELSSY